MLSLGFLPRWVFMNGAGMALAFLTFLHVLFVLAFGFEVELYWSETAVANIPAWILAGPLGFVLPLVLVWPFTAIWGTLPGPIEPFTIVGGALLGTGVLQSLTLSRGGTRPARWLVLWIAGLLLGMFAFAVVYVVIDFVVDINWAGEVALIGFAIGSCAATVSGRALARAVFPEPPAVSS